MALIELTQANFDDVIEKNEIVIVDFWASWCGPCKSFAPTFEQAALDYPALTFGKVNTEQETELSQDFNIRSIPLIMVIKQKIVIFSEAGTLPASALKDLIEQAIALDMSQVKTT